MHGLDMSNVSIRVVSRRDEPSGIWALFRTVLVVIEGRVVGVGEGHDVRPEFSAIAEGDGCRQHHPAPGDPGEGVAERDGHECRGDEREESRWSRAHEVRRGRHRVLRGGWPTDPTPTSGWLSGRGGRFAKSTKVQSPCHVVFLLLV